jgi:uncharacterized protein (TIGR00730 family)
MVVAVFGAHTPKQDSTDYQRAKELGTLLANAGFAVGTGGYDGSMAGVSEGASLAGGHVIAVTSTLIEQRRGAKLNSWVDQEINYYSLQDRLVHLVVNNDAMIVLPGGIGTLAELALAWNLLQVGELAPKPLVLLGSMWRQTMDAFINPEFVKQQDLGLLKIVDSPKQAVDFIQETLILD